MVFLKASPREIEQYTRIIKSLDQPVEQVDVAAVVYEYQVSEGEQTALGAVFKLAAGKLSGQIGAVQAVGDFLRLDTANLQILLSMLAEDKRFQLISNPNLRANSGTSSRISVGADVPTLSSTTNTNGTITQSVSYQKTGIILEVQPNVYQDAIEMKVRQTVSEAISTNTGVNNSPTLTTRELTTNIMMQDGEAVVLGGLTSTRVTDTATGLSFLPKFLRSKAATNDRTELLVFLRVSKAGQEAKAAK